MTDGSANVKYVNALDRAGIRFEKSRIGFLINCLLLGGLIARFVFETPQLMAQTGDGRKTAFIGLALVHDFVVLVSLVISLAFRRTRLLALLNSMYDFLEKESPRAIVSLGGASYVSLVFPILSILLTLRGNEPAGPNYIYVYGSLVVHICPSILYSLLVLLVASYARKEINGPLKGMSSLTTGRSLREALFRAKKRHFRLMNLAARLHSCFTFDFLNDVLYCVVRLLFFSYVSWKFTNEMMTTQFIAMFFTQLILSPLRLLYVCYCSHSLTLEVEKAINILTDFYIEKCEEMSPNVEEIIEVFLSQLSAKKGIFSPFGLFNVNLPFFCSYVGVVITYMIIIVQFS